MQMLQIKIKAQQFATRKDIARIFCYKDPTRLLKEFRDYANDNPQAFYPHKPFVKNRGMDTIYDIVSFAFYFENKDLLDAGNRSLRFKEELPRLKEVYQA